MKGHAMTYQQKVVEGRTLVKRTEEDQWRLAELTWQAVNEDGKGLREWAADIAVSPSHASFLAKVWSVYQVNTDRPPFSEAYREAKGLPADRAESRRSEAEATIRKSSPEHKREVFKSLAADPDVSGHDRTRFEAETAMREVSAPQRAERQRISDRADQVAKQGLGFAQALLDMDRVSSISEAIADAWHSGSDEWNASEREEFRTRWSETLHQLDIVTHSIASDIDAELARITGGAA